MIFALLEQNQTKVFVTISCNLCWMKRVQPRLHSAGSHVPEPRDDLHQWGGGSLGTTPAPRPIPPISGGEFLQKEGKTTGRPATSPPRSVSASNSTFVGTAPHPWSPVFRQTSTCYCCNNPVLKVKNIMESVASHEMQRFSGVNAISTRDLLW